MNNQFDELTKAMAKSVTRRAAMKKFGVGLAGMALACFGLADKAAADPNKKITCVTDWTLCPAGNQCCCQRMKKGNSYISFTYLCPEANQYTYCRYQCGG
jgi:hypothetical protein